MSAPAPWQQEAGSSGGGDQAADDFAAPGAPADGGLKTEPSLAVGSAEMCMATQAVVLSGFNVQGSGPPTSPCSSCTPSDVRRLLPQPAQQAVQSGAHTLKPLCAD